MKLKLVKEQHTFIILIIYLLKLDIADITRIYMPLTLHRRGK